MNGRVSIFKGDIYYSPNSSRDLVLARGNATDALLDTPASDTRDLQNPRRWIASTEWLAFVPRSPVAYNNVLFEPLAHIPQEIPFTAPYGYILPGSHLPLWCSIEDTLSKVITSLCDLYKLQPKFPSSPRQFGYDKVHETEELAMKAVAESRDRFSLWIGLLYWVIHKAADPGEDARGETMSPRWFVELGKIHHSQALLDQLLAEPLLEKHLSTDRVGVVLHPPDGQRSQPPAAWFISSGIPIWYRWGAREAKAAEVQPDYSLPAPPTSQLQEAATLLASSRYLSPPETQLLQEELSESSLTDLAQLLPRNSSAKAALQGFFRKRDAINRSRVRQKQATLEEGEISEDLPVGLAPVYVWGWDPEDPTLFTRMLVPQDKYEETLARYASHQKRYDPAFNEWDCCGEWDSKGNESTRNGGEKDSECRSSCDQVLSDPDAHAGPGDCALQSPTAHADITLDGTAETTVFDLLRLHYGFVPPLPLPETLASSSLNGSARNQDLLLHALALTSIPAGSSLLRKPLFQVYTQFMYRFFAKQPQKPGDDEWDLSPANRHSLTSCDRLKNVRLVTGKGNSNFKMYLFDFGSKATVPWKLAVYSSTTVLYVCRLKEEMQERNIVLALNQAGLPFRTFQEVDTFSDITETHPLADSVLLPIRVVNDSFTLRDWYWYEEQRRLVLERPRCARAALRRGGFAWRIARDVVDMDEASAGPSGRYANSDLNFSVLDDQGIEYVDDNLTTPELDVITGQYLTPTGQDTWETKRIWPNSREPSALAWWTEKLEQFYQNRVEVVLRDGELPESRIPRRRRRDRKDRTAKERLESWSDEFLTKQLCLPS